jgi:hypothetical protein
MPYCTLADIMQLMRETFTDASSPTRDDVEAICAQVSAELDGVAQAAGYDTPITSAGGLQLLKRYAMFGVAPQAWYARYSSQDEPPKVAYWREAYTTFLSRLRRNEQQLPDAPQPEDDNVAFAVAPQPQRDRYWSRGENLG